MKDIDTTLVHNSQVIQTFMTTVLGSAAPVKRLLSIDFNEQDQSYHQMITYWQKGVSDREFIGELLKLYADQGKHITLIVEVSPGGDLLKVLYMGEMIDKQ